MGRGPSYPYIGLEDAIGQSRKMYDYAKRGSAPIEAVVTEALKYSPTSSSGQKVLAALKAFGLVEDSPGSNGKAIKLTPRSIRILLDDQNSAERREELRKAAVAPKWYEYCWKKWGKDMPPAMRSNLLIEHGFVDSTVEGFLKDYRKTIAFAGLLDDAIFSNDQKSADESEEILKIGDYVQWESQGALRMPTAKRLISFSEDGNFAFVEGSATGIPTTELKSAEPPDLVDAVQNQPSANIFPSVPLASGGAKMQLDTLTLADGITIQIQWPASIGQEAYDDFLYQLEGFRRRVQRAVQKPLGDPPSRSLEA